MGFFDLIRPGWKHSDWEVRFSAISKITDQAVLAQVAIEDKKDHVRKAAVAKLTDQMVLTEVAIGSEFPHHSVGLAAVKNLTDQTLLTRVTIEAKDEHVCMAAADKVIDEGLRQATYASSRPVCL